MSGDSNYSFYVHYENLKNDLYRELSGARINKFFIPNYYYNWFYVPEKLKYNLLVKRQELGLNISDAEVNEYNEVRKNFLPKSKYDVVKKSFTTTNGVAYDDVVLERLNFKQRALGLFSLGLFAHFGLGLSRYWILSAIVPLTLMKYADSKFSPIEEIESFYNFVSERRDADKLYKKSKAVIDSIEDKKGVNTILRELQATNKSFVEAREELILSYLNAAIQTNNL